MHRVSYLRVKVVILGSGLIVGEPTHIKIYISMSASLKIVNFMGWVNLLMLLGKNMLVSIKMGSVTVKVFIFLLMVNYLKKEFGRMDLFSVQRRSILNQI